MANNYLQFSEEITSLTEDEWKWWEAKLEEIAALSELDEPTEEQEYLGFLASQFRLQFRLEGQNELWIVGEESGDIELIADVVQEFLKAHRPDGYWTATWACTCSKMRIGEFSGGGVFVSAEDIQFFNPHAQINEAIIAHRKSK